MIRRLWARLFGSQRSQSRANHPSSMASEFPRFRDAMRINNPDFDDEPPNDTLASKPKGW